MRRLAVSAISLIALIAGLSLHAEAATPAVTLTQECAGTTVISFTVAGLTNPQLPGSTTCAFKLKITTDANEGTVTLTAPAITGSTGSIPAGAFYGNCTATTNPSGIFTSSGTVQLASTPVTCGTIAANTSNKTIDFTVTLYIDETPDATSFPGDPAYVNSNLAVTANAP